MYAWGVSLAPRTEQTRRTLGARRPIVKHGRSFSLRGLVLPAPRVAGCGLFLLSTPWRFSFALRAPSQVARAAHRTQPSDPPSRATEQAQPGVRTLAVPLPRMRRSVGASVSTRRPGRSVPARFGVMAPSARGADLTTTTPFALALLEAFEQVLWMGGEIPPGGCQRPCLRRLRVTERASRGGVSLARCQANSEGPCRGTSLSRRRRDRSRRSLGAPRAGASKHRAAAHPLGNIEASRSREREAGSESAGR
jgi:hypothetical protein